MLECSRGKRGSAMTMPESQPAMLPELVGQEEVVDTKGPFVYIGRLESFDADSVVLADVDAHNTAESNTPTDLYLIQALKHGVRANRRRVYVLTREVVSLALLTDIVPY